MTQDANPPPSSGIASIVSAFLQNETSIKRFIRRFLYRTEDIDEIAQETFLRAYRATEGRQINSPKAYLFQVARTLAYRELSRKTRCLTDYIEDLDDVEATDQDTLEEECAAQQKIRHYFEAIASLPPQCRKVFLMRKVQAMPHSAIAETLGISHSAVEKHIARGTLRCKQFMDDKDRAATNNDESLPANAGTLSPGGQLNDQ